MHSCINNIILNGSLSSGQSVNIDSMLVMHRLILNGILKWCRVLLGKWTQNICCLRLIHSCINNIILNGNVSDPADSV